jgi:cullin-associated NEDD8-dissociated protein 1
MVLQALKLDAMMFIRMALDHHPSAVLQPSLGRLVPLVVAILGEDWYKIIAEALRVLGSIVQVMRPRDATSGAFLPSSYDHRPLVPVIYGAVLSRLSAQDIDQEIKECAISSMGKLMSHAGDELGAQLPTVLGLLQRRLENETTRSATLKTLIAVAVSPISLDLSSFVTSSVKDLSHFLRQNSRTLQQLTLQCLDALMASPSAQLTQDLISAVLQESHVLIGDTDLYLTHLSLRLTLTVLRKNAKASAEPIAGFIYQRIMDVSKSALIQGVALQSLISLFQELSTAGLAKMSFQDIFSSLYISSTAKGAPSLSKQALANLSKCIAGVMHGASPKVLDEVLARFTKDSMGADESTRQLALLSLGEVGQTTDLSQRSQVQTILLDCFESPSEDTKLAAAYALGHIAVGNMQVYLPVALQSAQSNKNQYLLLAALKEIIVVFANQGLDFQPYLGAVLPVLLEQCRSEEESVRNIVAECLGVLTATNIEHILPVLLDIASKDVEDKLSRRMVANALRFSLSRSSSVAATAALSIAMEQFLSLLEDTDLEVKRAALLMINTAVHHNPHSIEAHLSRRVMPLLLETLKIKLERTVDLGPFKHKVFFQILCSDLLLADFLRSYHRWMIICPCVRYPLRAWKLYWTPCRTRWTCQPSCLLCRCCWPTKTRSSCSRIR